MSEDPKKYLIGYRGGSKGGGWIPGFSNKTEAEDTLDEITEDTESTKDFGGGDDPAISMSGEE